MFGVGNDYFILQKKKKQDGYLTSVTNPVPNGTLIHIVYSVYYTFALQATGHRACYIPRHCTVCRRGGPVREPESSFVLFGNQKVNDMPI